MSRKYGWICTLCAQKYYGLLFDQDMVCRHYGCGKACEACSRRITSSMLCHRLPIPENLGIDDGWSFDVEEEE